MTSQEPGEDRAAFAERVRAANRDSADPVVQRALQSESFIDGLREAVAAIERGEQGVPFKQVKAEEEERRRQAGKHV